MQLPSEALISFLTILLNHKYCSGYIPPEYVRQGIYSMKSDVYSFGVLLLQIISGQRNAQIYGPNEDLSLLDYVSKLNQQTCVSSVFLKS